MNSVRHEVHTILSSHGSRKGVQDVDGYLRKGLGPRKYAELAKCTIPYAFGFFTQDTVETYSRMLSGIFEQ